MQSSQKKNSRAEPVLYRTYWALCLTDILYKNNWPITKKNKETLHEFHKRVLGYKTTENQSQEVMSRFVYDVCVFWATERGIFVRTNKDQPWDIDHLPLAKLWKVL
jgi:hypothetical protein